MGDSAPVVLVHGFASSSEHGWRPAGWMDLLREAGREVIAVDLPGHGTSARSTDPADYADVADTVAAAFADRGPVDAVGFSAGARLLLEIAARGLASFERIALMGIGPAVLEAREAVPFAIDNPDPADVRARLFRGLAKNAGNDLDALAAFARRPLDALTAVELAAVTCEVLVVTGERDTAGSPEELAAMLPNATGVTIEGADHFSLQSNMRAMDAVLSFLGV
ncbi:alpha/beta fold hydrolase [Frankia sp. CNm7]|uniref:Alpha/beta fold hydrolase n=1 Tax=Frankia nepalensis TaxID=1836974 RepID=A0A937RLB3_9ACTN|nr:alpha/beta fold hydrolase [Frankia nepalensis]MBL7497510.1 alpha/beta fold hydrolase [Frankia nepalensis]MBL7510223.1 alpha/beta fold hydrolase [Frankia nepalensis]MBL7523251.1 alpha/beta fold hydrolase [Frankia nepalensis]MBL7630934.1 alpha/beta fold hydrolase [Frankia nepalensis]